MKTRPKNCCYPDCFHCPYVDCRWNGDPAIWKYNHSDAGKLRDKKYMKSEKGKEAQKRYDQSEKGKERSKRKAKKRNKSGKNAEACRRYYAKHREEILRKKKNLRKEAMQSAR